VSGSVMSGGSTLQSRTVLGRNNILKYLSCSVVSGRHGRVCVGSPYAFDEKVCFGDCH
jgi:hypothetical protein